MNIKLDVINELKEQNIDLHNLEHLFVLSNEPKNGEVCFPCFALAKELKQSPIEIAENFTKSINIGLGSGLILKAEAVNGYVNIFVDKTKVAKRITDQILQEANLFGSSEVGKGQTIVLDYSSVNLAKYMHIGHLKTTIIGLVMKNIYESHGFKTVSINYVGDYGTPFGKMITALKKWSSVDEVEKGGVDKVQDLYVRFNQEAVNDESLEQEARDWFKKIEDGDKEAVSLSNKIIEICREECERLCTDLGAKFDSWRGERYYSDKMDSIVKELNDKGLTKQSEGALIVDLSQFDLGVALIQKSDGTSLYLTRDLAAVEDRYKNYKFDKAVYVTGIEQKLHFKQLFKIVELLQKPYAGKLEHLSYGRYSMPEGKISSRLGKQALLRELLEAGIEKSREIMENRGTRVDNPEKVSKQIALGAVSFEALKLEKIKDTVYDMDASLSFDGETSPYMQYTYARCCSILSKAKDETDLKKLEYKDINDADGFLLLKLANKYPQVVEDAKIKQEPSHIIRLLMEMCSEFNRFYTNNRIIDNGKINYQNLSMVECVKIVLENGFKLVNIPAIEKM